MWKSCIRSVLDFRRYVSLRLLTTGEQTTMAEDISVKNFRNYLRINSEQPNPDYEACKGFLLRLADELRLEKKISECVPGKPIIILTHRGTNPGLPSLLLNSHTDVVPTFKDFWKYDPYAAFKDSDGKIYGRGTQDMKSVGIQYLEALRRLQNRGNNQFLRTVHFAFVPDEEIGGKDGMEAFVETEEFRNLNVGFAVDEGVASEGEEFKVFYGERSPWWSVVTCKGRPGHGSLYLDGTASEKFRKVIDSFLSFGDEQKQLLRSDPRLTIGDVITVNLTKVEGGVEVNVLPAELKAYFDIRVPPTQDFEAVERKFKGFCSNAGTDVEMSFLVSKRMKSLTLLDDEDPWWKSFCSIFEKLDLKITKQIFPGSTDARFIRSKGYKAIGFSPINNTPVLLHENNEYLEENVFLRGVEIYENLITSLANVPES